MSKTLATIAALGTWLGGASAAAAEKAADKPASAKAPAKAPEKAPPKVESIGSATMKADGTLVLVLRATTGGAVGDAALTYARSHPEYANILKHLGGLKPGESKPVPPFP